MLRGLKSKMALAAIAGSAGVAATGPSSWDPWAWWDSELSLAGDLSTWDDQVSSRTLDESGTATLNSADADWNSRDSISLSGLNHFELNTTDTPLADQRFLFDGTDYDARLILEVDGAGGADAVIDMTGAGSGTGLKIEYQGGSQRFDVEVYDGGTLVAQAVSPIGSVPTGVPTYLAWRVNSSVLEVSVNGGPWVSSVGASFVSGTDSTTTLKIAPTVGIKCLHFFVSKTVASASRQDDQLDYYLGIDNGTLTADGWVDQYPVSANGFMVTADSVTTSGSDVTQMTDISGNANHLTDSGSGNRPALDSSTYSSPVVDFDGVGEWLVMPTGVCSAMTGGADQPCAMGASIRATGTGGALVEVGSSGTDYPIRYVINSTTARQFRRRDSSTGDKTADSTASFSASTWETNVARCDGTAVEIREGFTDSTSTSDVDVDATTSATTGRLGSDNAGTIFYQGQLRRLWFDAQDREGMHLAKLTRWEESEVSSL